MNGGFSSSLATVLPSPKLRPIEAVWLACLVLPWLNPFAGGPSASVLPWLFSAICAALALGLMRPVLPQPAACAGLGGLAAWVAARSGASPETMALFAACLLIFMAAVMGAGASQCRPLLRAVALGWLLAATISTAIALLQYFGVSDRLAPWTSVAAAGEAFANLRQRNQFASLTVIGMASFFWLFPDVLRRGPTIAATMWLAAGNAATTSRTGLAQLFLLVLLACMWPGPRRARAVLGLIGLLTYVVTALTLPWLLEAATGTPGSRLWERVAAAGSCSSRTVLWGNVLELIAEKPWLGWGWGELDYAHFMTLYGGPRFCDILDNAHNLPLDLAVELGVPAALLLCGGMAWVALRAKPWREPEPTRQMAWAVLAVVALHSLLEYPLWYGPFQIAFGLCLGLLWPARSAGSQAKDSPGPVPPGLARLLAAGVLLACAYAAWDYRRISQIYLPPEARSPALREDPLAQARSSWLFGNQVRFAELTITPLTVGNAAWAFEQARTMLHFSPEPRVIEKLIESQLVLGRDEELLLNMARFRAAFPEAYQQWSQARSGRGAATLGNQPAR